MLVYYYGDRGCAELFIPICPLGRFPELCFSHKACARNDAWEGRRKTHFHPVHKGTVATEDVEQDVGAAPLLCVACC